MVAFDLLLIEGIQFHEFVVGDCVAVFVRRMMMMMMMMRMMMMMMMMMMKVMRYYGGVEC